MASLETLTGSACERSLHTLSVQHTDSAFSQIQNSQIDLYENFSEPESLSTPSSYSDTLSHLRDYLDHTMQNYILSMRKTARVLEQAKEKLSAGLGISGTLLE